ncbi:hypothetical protein DICPUDRAFT_40970 [Dictyostelium purpureum]|uniref:NFACT RNA-binding domain-containing protein n=1 Tax=Dictyostelium purpureum TaxID=5786 RepID=F0ZZ59_DICPU|nr:uncharacterized protein DICPUDRAFT_40970 [Dictyostelium purpureum]EGC30763.1 hypothetical protein DICPUDRAFT_40970 [Dictyostelium purpureum]|eukprot:XP_003292703.1 hypothetical protein DICPUDRAFT_40970 [Dictyostelium purpureum]
MKTRFSSIDIRTTVFNLQKSLIGLRLANLYDLSPRVFLLKFSRPDFKKNLIIESGIRIHSTNFIRDKGDHTPAPFSLTLRKYLKTKRLESVKQLGVDRVVDFTFGSGVAVQHLIIELYSIGNIILTDGDYRILAILRTHQYNQDESVAVGDVYPVNKAKKPTEFTTELIDSIIENTQDKKETLKQVFNKSLDFGPELIEHCILSAGLQPSLKLEQYDHSVSSQALISAFKEGQKIYDQSVASKGYIVLKDPKQQKPQQQKKQQQQTSTTAEPPKEIVMYEEFVPFLYKQYESKKYIEYDSFDGAVDQFFSEIESQKLEQQRIQQEQTVLKKLDKVKEDQQRRIDSLFANEAENVRKAELIEANLQEVDQCILIIRSGVANSMNWDTLNQLLKEEKKKNPYSVATKIQRLKLESNQITLALTDGFLYDDDEEVNKTNKKPTLIDVDISLSAFANARKYYDTKKQSHEKAQKTISQAEFALKAAESKTRQQLSEVKSKHSMIQMRKVFWFEKFHWFISSDNYIVVSGRDAQQNELLFKKYLEKDDVYVHADIFGSTSCVIKNPNGGEIPPNTLIQAGTMTMCYSNAWSAKVVTSAYWVYSHQVSKTAPSGEYLTTGSFMIRGKKNYLPHSQLVMGFGFMFKIDESCIGNHLNERKPLLSGSNNHEDDGDASNNSSEIVTTNDDEKHLRKFERTKLKKEQKEMKELEELTKLEIKEGGGDIEEEEEKEEEEIVKPAPTTKTATKPSTNDKYKIQLVSSFKDGFGGDDEDNEDDEDEDNKDDDSKGRSKGYISAHQRKLMKKGISLEEAETLVKEKKEKEKENEPEEKQEKQEKKPKNEPQKHLLPSQKNKLKKIKEKYGHQDEEERIERMEILGSADIVEKEDDESNDESSSDDENKEESEEAKELKRKSRKEKREAKLKEQEEIKKLLEEENTSKAVDDQTISNIDTLTGQPRDDDILHFAIPVVAPYSVFNNYKFKVKLTPGHLKRGKAAKQAAQVILQSSIINKREKELIKNIKDEDLTSNMLADVKLHAPNLLQTQKKEKKERKERAKEKANELKESYKDKDISKINNNNNNQKEKEKEKEKK